MHLHIIPSIEQLRRRPALQALEASFGRDAVVSALRDEAAQLRARLSGSDAAGDLPPDAERAAEYLERRAEDRLAVAFRGSLRRVINATGVVLHTNLGRAPLAPAAIERLVRVGAGYTNLEYDLEAGQRGSRDVHISGLLSRLTGTDSAVVVNNNAAATLLILTALAAGREVVVSRGELVEIGGGFRVPDVMAQSGAILREVGTTNKTRLSDYEQALGERTALILRVHRSNFRIEGFTEQPALAELVALGRRAGIPVVEDLGSGLLDDVAGSDVRTSGRPDVRTSDSRSRPTLGDEPTVIASVQAGVDVVCFSGDKLLGGPQAGIIVGRRKLIGRIRRHPLMRALRVDKLTYAALEGTLLEYFAGRAAASIPVVRMLSMPADAIRARAAVVQQAVGDMPGFTVSIVDGESMVGGGSAPGVPIPTCLIALQPRTKTATEVEAALRAYDPPVIARVENDTVLLDLRTVAPDEDLTLVEAIQKIVEIELAASVRTRVGRTPR